jgi:hypothetical protein
MNMLKDKTKAKIRTTYIFFGSTFLKVDIEQQSTFTYKLKIHGEYKKSLMISLIKTKLLPGVHYNSETEDLLFVAESVDTLERTLERCKDKKMPHDTCVKMIYCLSKQLDELEKLHKMFYGLDLNDILVINDDIFIIATSKYLMPMSDKHITFYAPFHIPTYASPELKSIKGIPTEVHYKTIYYSLGKICEEVLKVVLENTKMHWFLKRCFEKEPSKRSLLFI